MGLFGKLRAAGLGVATGTIIVNTSQLSGAAAVARQTGNQIAGAMNSIGGAGLQAENSWRQLRLQITAVGTAANAIFGLGTRAAAYYQEAALILRGLVGDQQKAVQLNAQIRDTARKMGVPYSELLHATRLILPTLEGQTDELEKQWQLIRRVAVLNPAQGISMAAFAVNEALISNGRDLMSLAERFNMSRNIFREELSRHNRDFWAALDATLDRMGVTTELADEMAKTFNASFRIARDGAIQLIAEGFQPILDIMSPLLRAAADWMAKIRETEQATLSWGAALVTVAALGVPTILMLTKLVSLAMQYKKAIIVGAAAQYGLNLGRGFAGAIYGKDSPAAKADWSYVGARLVEVVTLIIYALSKLSEYLGVGVVQAVRGFVWVLNVATEAFLNFVKWLNSSLPGWAQNGLGSNELQQRLEFNRGVYTDWLEGLDEATALWQAKAKGFNQNLWQFARDASDLWGFRLGSSGANAPAGPGAHGAGGVSQDALDATIEYIQGIEDLERKLARERTEAEEEYGRERQKVIEQHGREIVREEQDFARERARANADFQKSLWEVIRDQMRREQEWREDFNDKIEELEEDHRDKLKELEEDYAKEREEALRDHHDKLLEAAANLDAKGVWEEQKRFNRQMQNLKDKFEDRLNDENKQLEKRRKDEAEDLEKRIQKAREQDAQRMQDMRADFEERIRREDEDRELRKQREAEDFQDQLDTMAENHTRHMEQLDQQWAEESTKLSEKYQDALADLGIFGVGWLKEHERLTKAATDLFTAFWNNVIETLNDEKDKWNLNNQYNLAPGAQNTPVNPSLNNQRNLAPDAGRSSLPNGLTGFALGGLVTRTGLALVHAGEVVLPHRPMQQVQRGHTFESGAIQVFAAPGMDEQAVARAVRREFITVLEEVAA